MKVEGFDSIEVHEIDGGKYRIVLVGDGLTIDALLFGEGAEAIAGAISGGTNPRDLIAKYKDERLQRIQQMKGGRSK